jgi:hypothetical protein
MRLHSKQLLVVHACCGNTTHPEVGESMQFFFPPFERAVTRFDSRHKIPEYSAKAFTYVIGGC